MATFIKYKNRALVIATLGLLTSHATTIATDGIIQYPDPNAAGPPVAAAPERAFGPLKTRIEYSNQHHWSSRFACALDLTARTNYAPAVFNSYQHRGRLYSALAIKGVDRALAYHIHGSRLVYGLKVAHIARQPAPERVLTAFSYGIQGSAKVFNRAATRALHDAMFKAGIRLAVVARHLPIEGASVYSHRQVFRHGLALDGGARFTASPLNAHNHAGLLPFRTGFESRFTYSAATLNQRSVRGVIRNAVTLRSATYLERAPVVFRDDEEAVLVLAANYLLDTDDG